MKLLPFMLSALMPITALAGETVEQLIEVPKGNTVYIENDQGKVTVIGWDNAQMKVSGELDDRAKGYSLKTVGKRTEFVVEMPRNYKHKDEEGSKLTIYVPKSNHVNLETINADLDISDLEKGINLDTVNGDVEVSNVQGDISLDTVNGNINSTNLNGNIRFETVNGDIKDSQSVGEIRFEAVNGNLNSLTQSSDIRIETVNGDVAIKANEINDIEITTVGGEVEVSMTELSKGASVQAESVNGDIEFKFPKSLSAEFDINAHAGGKIKNNLSTDKVKKAKYGPSSSLEFQLNGGDVEVEIDTVNGRVELKYN